jgi:hypothetical protein
LRYRDRRLRKAERLRDWAEKREQKSAAAFKTARTVADGIPLGQPILVGHHSEKRHRADIARIDNGMRKGIEHERKADEMQSRAANIEAAADRAIYSDDEDAIGQLRARVAELEAERERVKAANKAIRAHGLARLLEPDPPFTLTPAEARELLSVARLCPYHQVESRGFPAYHLQNLGGNITRNRKRLELLEREEAARATGITIEFHSKPSEEIRTAIKARGFRWDRTRELWYRSDTPDARSFAAYVTEHQDVPPGAAEFLAWVQSREAAPAPVVEAPAVVEDAERDRIDALAREMQQAEQSAPAIADVPFSLEAEPAKRRTVQGGLF